MTNKKKLLKIKVGEVFMNGKSHPVFQTASQKESKDKKTIYYEFRTPVFVQTYEPKQEPELDVEVIQMGA